ncbi:MAG: hypothetical protein AAF153_03240, partial [Pseudomonadota bacterium]
AVAASRRSRRRRSVPSSSGPHHRQFSAPVYLATRERTPLSLLVTPAMAETTTISLVLLTKFWLILAAI